MTTQELVARFRNEPGFHAEILDNGVVRVSHHKLQEVELDPLRRATADTWFYVDYKNGGYTASQEDIVFGRGEPNPNFWAIGTFATADDAFGCICNKAHEMIRDLRL